MKVYKKIKKNYCLCQPTPKILKKYTQQLLGQKIYNKSTEVLNLLCYTNNIEVHSCYYDCLIGCDMKNKKKNEE